MPLDLRRIRRQAEVIAGSVSREQEAAGKLARVVIELCDELGKVMPTVTADPVLDSRGEIVGQR